MPGRGKDSESVSALVGRLVDDTRGLAKAELELAKARVGERVTSYRAAAIMFAVAGALGFAGLIALIIGLILSLATLVGPGLATAIVTLATFALAGVLAMIGKSKLAKPEREVR